MPRAKLKRRLREVRSVVEVDKMIRRGQCLTKTGHTVAWRMAIKNARVEVAITGHAHD